MFLWFSTKQYIYSNFHFLSNLNCKKLLRHIYIYDNNFDEGFLLIIISKIQVSFAFPFCDSRETWMTSEVFVIILFQNWMNEYKLVEWHSHIQRAFFIQIVFSTNFQFNFKIYWIRMKFWDNIFESINLWKIL